MESKVRALSLDGQEDVFDLVRIAITFADTPNPDPLRVRRTNQRVRRKIGANSPWRTGLFFQASPLSA
jgi:hypothetical protein